MAMPKQTKNSVEYQGALKIKIIENKLWTIDY
jgi:hypothetical protein